MQLCDTPDQAAAYWRLHVPSNPYFNPECECFTVLLLNTRRRVKGHQIVSFGTHDTILVHPLNVFRLAVMTSAAAVVLIAALVLRFSVIEFVALVLCFTVVVAAELFNTTLEVLIDYAWPEHHPMIGRAKDVAAAAVLVAAAGAAIVGVLLFARHILLQLS